MSRDTEIIEKLKTEYRVTDDMREYKDPEKENEIYYQYSSDGKWIVEIKIQVIQYTEKLEGFILQLKNLEVLEILYGRDEEIQIDVKYSAFQNLKELLLSHHCNFSSELILKYKNLRSLSVSKTDTWDLFFQFLEKKQRSSLEFLNLTNANFSSLPVSVSKLKNLKSLDLSRCKELNSLPDWIGELSLLESLNLSSMSISMLPVSVSKLKNLKSLDLSGCSEPNSFPECIGELFQLESLNLSSMSISMLPVFVSKLKNLKSLNLSGCSELNSLPDWIGELSLLEYLDLSITNISTLPVSVSKLKNLKNLDFSSCSELNSLPECIGENFLLETLDLSDTKISTLPTSVSKLKNLKTLWLTSCEKLNSLPECIGELSLLETLDLHHTKISTLPVSVSKLKNLKRLLLLQCEELNSLPECIGELSLLEYLNLGITKISSLPSSISKLKNLKGLNLSGCSELKSLPKRIGELSLLETLDLDSTKINTLPSSISKLKNLKSLSLSNCSELNSLPKRIGELSLLETLDLDSTKISTLPASVSKLKNLKSLSLSNCSELNSLPEWIGELFLLENLDLGYTQISILPKSISRLKNLKSLSLDHCNKMSSLPEWIGELPLLENLGLRSMNISILPAGLKGFKGIGRIDLAHNCISILPEWITDLNLPIFYIDSNRIVYRPGINLTGNPIETPPLDIVKKGNEAIKDYFRQIREQGLDVLYESKLIIVGEGDSGKTTLSKKLQNHSLELPETQSTLGVEVQEGLQFTHSEDENIQIAVNVWDFGGQEIQYQLHQYFFSPNALYIIVADNRAQNTRWDYWFQIIHLLGGKCSVFVIMNNKKTITNISNFKRDHYKKEFSELKITEASADFSRNNEDWNAVLRTMKKELSSLPAVRKEVPRLWKKLRDLINEERKKFKYIKFDDFLKKAKEIGINSEADAVSALQYFHDIGIILYFPKDITLRLVVFLDPNWITQGLYSALSGENSEVKNGCFTQDWIDSFWAKMNYTMAERTYLLQLMLKDSFDVCYEIGGGKFIVPMLLNDSKPSYEWDSKDNLHFRYQYPFLPKGMISRLIVKLHTIVSGNLIWQDGAVFTEKEVHSEVIQKSDIKTGLKYLGIRVSGKNLNEMRELLSRIRYEIESIHHKSFNGIKHDKIVFCNCLKCHNSEEPYPFACDEIMEYIQEGSPSIECRKLKRPVQIAKLLGAVFTEKEYEQIMKSNHYGDIYNLNANGDITQANLGGQKNSNTVN